MMSQLFFQRSGSASRASPSLPSHYSFPQRTLYTVPEHELESCASASPARLKPASPYSPRSDHGSQSLNVRDSSHSLTSSRLSDPRPSFAEEAQKPVDQGSPRRACGWTCAPRTVLHLVNLVASITILVLVAQALRSHRKLRRIRQLNGADNPWPKNMSFTPSIVLLSVGSAGVIKSAAFLVAEVRHRTKVHNSMFLIILTVCSAVMAAIWVSATVFVEMKRQNDDNFTTWACARSDAAVNHIIPYRMICDEEVGEQCTPGCVGKPLTSSQTVASQLAVAVLVVEMVLGTSSGILIILSKFYRAKA
jgi:hypothetical protein